MGCSPGKEFSADDKHRKEKLIQFKMKKKMKKKKKKKKKNENENSLGVPSSVDNEAMLEYLISGDFHSDLAKMMTSEVSVGEWSMRKEKRERIEESNLPQIESASLIPTSYYSGDKIADSCIGTEFSVVTKNRKTREIDTAYIYRIVDYAPSFRVVFSVTTTSETETTIHEQIAFLIESLPNGRSRLILRTHAEIEADAVTQMLQLFAPLHEHVRNRALIHLLCVKSAFKRLGDSDADDLSEEISSERTNTPPPGPLLAPRSNKSISHVE